MERIEYSSDSSDSEHSYKTLNLSRIINETTLEYNLEYSNDKKENVEVILLNYNELKQIPLGINEFRNLRVLDVSSNGLRTLPDIFKYCATLKTLIAKNNQLTNESLPKCFTGNSLRELNFSGNQLDNFPEQVLDFIHLKYLYLGGNCITNISRNIGKLVNLQVLSMGGNKLAEVPTSVGTLKQLQALYLCDNSLESLPASIANLRHLKTLLLHKNKLRTLPQEIIALKNLTELSLRDNPLVVRFVSDMTHNPASLLELSARAIKLHEIPVQEGDVPTVLLAYLQSAHHCVNSKCRGVFFDNRVEHVKFVDFCGKYRIPLLHYLCSSKCITGGEDVQEKVGRSDMMRKVLLG